MTSALEQMRLCELAEFAYFNRELRQFTAVK